MLELINWMRLWQELRPLATAPDLYPTLVQLGCVKSFLGLLSHENADIAVAAVDLLQELTDVDTLNESEEGAASLVDSLAAEQACPLLVQNLDRLDENVREEADGVHATLAVFENLVEFRPEACGEAAEAGLLNWLVKKLKVSTFYELHGIAWA
jgi:beta-catenin-like protein 1